MTEEDDFNTRASEIIARYRAGERLFDDADVAPGDSFRGVSLVGAHFRNAWLHSTDFNGADLRDTIFETACLKCIDFRGADLRGARFINVAICGSDFSGAKYEGSSVRGVSYYGLEVDDLAGFCESSPRKDSP